MFVNRMPRYEILSEDAVATLDGGWRRIVSELGIEFLLPEAVDAFAQAGQEVDGDLVKLDPDFVLEQVAKAPREFDVQARNPENSIHIGGDSMAFGAVYGPPFVREGEVRRDATMEDFRNFTKLAQSFPVLDSAGVLIGIMTIDDVLKIAEKEATREIQRIGSSEVLDEPYMQIALARMVKTALRMKQRSIGCCTLMG